MLAEQLTKTTREETTVLNEAKVRSFAARLNGKLIRPEDDDYDEARAVWNGMIDRYPALIARCANTDDVVTALNFARENNLIVAVRGGGERAYLQRD